ncbi:MAG: hypothetical protein U0795_05030 [Pirellulales bacterium]
MNRTVRLLLATYCLMGSTAPLWAQYPPGYGASPYGTTPAATAPPQATAPSVWPSPAGAATSVPTTTAPAATIPPATTSFPSLPAPPPAAAPTAGTVQPFDPYSTSVPTGPGYPSNTWLPGNIPPAPTATPGLGEPSPYTPAGSPTGVPAPPGYTNPYGAAPAPTGTQPLFPTDPFTGPNPPFQRLFENTGVRYTFLYGDDGDQLMINEFDFSTTLNLPNTIGGLKFSPGFTLDLLSGPQGPVPADLPPQLYAAYFDTFWNPKLTACLSAELNLRIGVYSDFNTFTNDSIRYIGTGLGVLKLTPSSSAKLGIAYIDRNQIKLLPAIGILCEPNKKSRYDIFFPAPKLSHYLANRGNTEWWWYVAGEYGGGAWTIERQQPPSPGASDSIDINDIRVFVGVEGWNINRFHLYFEAGYVFDRSIYYVLEPTDTTDLDDTWMLGAGVSF